MSKTGLAEAPQETTEAPATMYREIEQEDNVARGHVRITEVIAYEPTKTPRRYPPEKEGLQGEIMKDKNGDTLYVENGREPYFCQSPEDIYVFQENNPGVRTETFTVDVLKSTAQKYMDSPRNMKAFGRIK